MRQKFRSVVTREIEMEPKGSPIPGSRFYRWYCESCGTPMRVIMIGDRPMKRECEECDPHRPPPPPPRRRDDEGGGAWDNVVRALEE